MTDNCLYSIRVSYCRSALLGVYSKHSGLSIMLQVTSWLIDYLNHKTVTDSRAWALVYYAVDGRSAVILQDRGAAVLVVLCLCMLLQQD